MEAISGELPMDLPGASDNNGTILSSAATNATHGEMLSPSGRLFGTANAHGNRASDGAGSSFELVMITLTLPLWTFITLYVLLLLIYYLRHMQYFSVYDKCSSRNAHFRYNFHLIVGRHSQNYNRNENLIVDLLDNQLVASMTIQIPGSTIYNDQQMFVYRHARSNQRCVGFTVYRRHPMKDIKCIRVAHSCSNQDSRVFVYGLDVHDQTNGERRFFPVQSVVKYRGTQWALVTTFEQKPELSFKSMGLECYDPFGYTVWPTYLETLTLLLYVWCSSACFGHLISARAISHSVPLHALALLFIVATSGAVLSAIYLRLIKTHIQDLHYDSHWWKLLQHVYLLLVILVSVAFWALALGQSKLARHDSIQWLISTTSCSLVLTTLVVFVWFVSEIRRGLADRALLAETEANMMKTNSKEALPFVVDPAAGLCALFTRASARPQQIPAESQRSGAKNPTNNPAANKSTKTLASTGKRKTETSPAAGTSGGGAANPTVAKNVKTGDDETLDTAFGHGSKYMKTRNRNSISQYV